HDLSVSVKFASYLKNPFFKRIPWKTYEPGSDFSDTEVMISIGGDGTLLETVSHIGRAEVPVLGINTGRLGFLATVGKDEIESALAQLVSGSYRLDKRSMLQLDTNENIFGSLNFALNDFTIVKKDTSSMITIHTFIDGEFF